MTNWQEWYLSLTPIIFGGCLIVALKDKSTKFPKWSSKITAFTLYGLSATYSTMNLLYPAITTAILGGLWNYISFARSK